MTTTTTAQSHRIRHAPECRPTAADYVKTRGGKGDLLLRCQSCRQFVVLAPAATRNTPRPTPEHTPKPAPATAPAVAAVDAPEPAPEPAVAVARYRCGDHPEVPVTWKGTGCPECEHEHAARQRDREHAARARRERAERERQG